MYRVCRGAGLRGGSTGGDGRRIGVVSVCQGVFVLLCSPVGSQTNGKIFVQSDQLSILQSGDGGIQPGRARGGPQCMYPTSHNGKNETYGVPLARIEVKNQEGFDSQPCFFPTPGDNAPSSLGARGTMPPRRTDRPRSPAMPEGVGYKKKRKPKKSKKRTATPLITIKKPPFNTAEGLEDFRMRRKEGGDRREARLRRNMDPRSLTSRRVRDSLRINKAAKAAKKKKKKTPKIHRAADQFLNLMVRSATQAGNVARGRKKK